MNEQLTSDELRQVLAEWIRPMYPKERQKIAGLFEAVIARAETAEADNRRLTARVAELEAQVAWRPGSENPPAPDWYQVGDIGVGVYDLWYSGEAWHRSSFQGATYRTPPMSTPDFWRFIPPLPPAPQETTR